MIDEGGGHINQHGLQLISLVASNGSNQEGWDDDSEAQAELCHGTRSVVIFGSIIIGIDCFIFMFWELEDVANVVGFINESLGGMASSP